jgi:hypothetical protein
VRDHGLVSARARPDRRCPSSVPTSDT